MAQLTAVSSPVVQRHTPWNRNARTFDVWCEAFAPHVANSQGEAPQYVPLHHRTRAVIVDFSSSRLGRLIARLGSASRALESASRALESAFRALESESKAVESASRALESVARALESAY